MDVVLRTPHGEGEISLVADSTSVTLGDVVERVLGHPAPPVLYVDGRAASAQTFLSEAGVVIGSLIDTDDAAFDASHGAPVEIWQLAGYGCGMTSALRPGDYRIGPGRRIHAVELAMAPVDEAVMELKVTEDGRVMVRDRGGVELLGGPPTSPDRFVDWTDEPLSVEGRIFTLRRSIDSGAAAAEAHVGESVARRPTASGTITFHRAVDGTPTAAHPEAPPSPIDALALARTRSTRLWRHRGMGPGEFRIPLGLHITDAAPRQPGGNDAERGDPPSNGTSGHRRLQPIEAVLEAGRGLALVGRSDFTRSATAGLLVLASTMYGPADLEVVVVTTADRADSWEWTKWLPHNRIEGHPNVIVTEQQLRGWLRRRRSQWTSSRAVLRRTLMVVDDENAWHERSSPLREIVADESVPISFAVLTTHLHDVPTLCETVVSERSHGTAHVELRQRRRRYDDVHAFVVSTDLAAEVARRLAPLDDASLVPPPDAGSSDRLSIDELHTVGSDPRPTIAHRWFVATHDDPTAAGPLSLRLGFGSTPGPKSTDIVSIDVTRHGPHLLVVAADAPPDADDADADADADAVVEAALIGACVDQPPDELEIALLSGGTTSQLLARLPHVSVNMGHLGQRGLRRAIRSLLAEHRRRRAVLERAGVGDISALHERGDLQTLRRLVVVVDELDAMTNDGVDDLRPIIELGPEVGIHIIVHAHDADVDPSALGLFGATVAMSRTPADGPHADGGSPDPSARATLRIGGGPPIVFEAPTVTGPPDDDALAVGLPATDGLSIQPFVVARDLTPMERRLVGNTVGASTPAPTARRRPPSAMVIAVLEALVAEALRRPRVGPPPIADELPDHLDLIEFLDEHPGDGVPFALGDAPEQQGHEPIWWLPGGNSSIVAYGVARSRVSALIPALAVGAATRLGTADVRFHIVCPETGQLEPLNRLPHTASLTAARARTMIELLIDDLRAEVDRRLDLVRSDVSAARVAASETTIAVLIDDVGGCRRHLEGGDRDLWVEFEDLLVRGQPVGICAVLIARRTDEISARLAATIDTHLVAQLAVNDTEHRFVRPDDRARSDIPGRARRDADGVELQFATLPADLTTVITERVASRNDRERP